MGAINMQTQPEQARQYADSSVAPLLKIPPELRNHIYHLIFATPVDRPLSNAYTIQAPSLANFGKPSISYRRTKFLSDKAAVVRSCRQVQHESQLLFLSTTPFHLFGADADPEVFASLTSHLPLSHKQAVRHIVLNARITQLRALNEQWNAMPFGHSDFSLDTLTVVPSRPETHMSALAEIADLSQCHTLAYILAETLKALHNVGVVIVRNDECFNDIIWKLAYRSMVYRLWRWGGRLLDLKFREDESGQSFEVLCTVNKNGNESGKGWTDVQAELSRLIGSEATREGLE